MLSVTCAGLDGTMYDPRRGVARSQVAALRDPKSRRCGIPSRGVAKSQVAALRGGESKGGDAEGSPLRSPQITISFIDYLTNYLGTLVDSMLWGPFGGLVGELFGELFGVC